MESRGDISKALLPVERGENVHTSPTSTLVEPSNATISDHHPQPPWSAEQDSDVNQASLADILEQLRIQEKPPMAERMFASLGVVVQHAAEEHELDVDVQEVLNALQRAGEESRRGLRDIEALSILRTFLGQLLPSNPQDLLEAASILANASRDSFWRPSFGQSGLLDFFLHAQTINDGENGILIQSLRIIGNACADTDINRELAISQAYLPSLVRHVKNPRLSNIIIPVIYNICNDYERAQHAFRMHGLCPALISLLADPQFDAVSLLTYICVLLDLSTEQYDLVACSDHSISTLVELLQHDDIEPDDMLLVVNAMNVFLRHERFQRYFVEHDLVNILVEVIVRLSPIVTARAPQTNLPSVGGDADDEVSSSLQGAMIHALSDISATSDFAEKYTINSSLVTTLTGWLGFTQPQQIQICACLMLGNLARSDVVCQEMVNRLGLHGRLLELLEDQIHPQVSYAALGFLRNLTLPTENKGVVGTQRSVELISRFWSVDANPQIQHASVSLLRQLLNGCIGNVRWLLDSLSTDQDSPAYEKTYLSLLLLLFRRTDDAATQFEIARTVATICRCISSSSQGLPLESTNAIWHRLYGMHLDIATPLAMMISQSRFPILRSEGWFALALMARTREGSAAVSEVFQQLEVFGVLVTTITGQSTNGSERRASGPTTMSDNSDSDSRPEQVEEMKAKDRENALVLVNELLRHTGNELSVIRRSVLEDLMRGPQSPEGAQELMTRAQSEE